MWLQFGKYMARNIHEITESIGSKVAVIIERQAQLVEAVERQRAEAEGLRKRIGELEAEVKRLAAGNEYLAVVKAATVTPEQAEQSRAMLAELVREIDRCIAELKAC